MPAGVVCKAQARRMAAAGGRRRLSITPLNVVARFGGGRGNVLDRPDVDVSKRLGGFDFGKDWSTGEPPSTEMGRDGAGVDKDRASPPGGGNYRVILVDSPTHSEKVVVQAICSVVSNISSDHARNCYNTSKQLGMALITSCLKEHAEFYNQQLYMSYRVKTTIEPDSTVA